MEANKKPDKKMEDVGDDKKSLVVFEIEKAKKAGMNMLLPSTHVEGLSKFHFPVIDYVQLSPEPRDGDVYFHKESGKFVPSKQGLMKLAVCAGISWHPTETRRVDNRQDRDYVSYVATGGVRKADGQMVWLKAEWDMDFEVIEDELRSQYEASGKKKKKTGTELQNYVDYCVKRDLLYRRKHKVKLCEAGAMNRVIRSLLGLRSGYTKPELQKPFVVARITFRPDYSDPQIRKAMIQKSIESITNVYGGSDNDEQIMPSLTSPPIEIPSDVIDVESESAKERSEKPKQTHQKADFEASDKKGQIHTLETLAKRKGYDFKQLKRPLDTFSDDNREDFFDQLMETEDEDLPF